MRHLQLKRNALTNIFSDRNSAKNILTTLLQDVVDGEPLIVRYKDANNKICAMLGLAYKSGTVTDIYTVDATDLIEDLTRIKVAVGLDANGNYSPVTGDSIIGGATSVKHATQLISNYLRQLQSELDTTQTGAGLNANGTYSPNTTKRFISGATSLFNADIRIHDILVSVVDGSGLNPTTGKYVQNTTTPYISGATTLNDADVKLAQTIKALNDKVLNSEYVKDIKQTLKTNTNYTVSEADNYNVVHDSGTGDYTDILQLTYTPISPLALKVPTTIGDIERGMSAAELNGKPLSKILDDIIFKTIYPKLVNPTATIAFNGGFTNGSVYIMGATAPTPTNLRYTYVKGKASVNDGITADKDYTGDATTAQYQMNYTGGTANTNAGVVASGTNVSNSATLATTFGVGTYSYRTIVSYGVGQLLTTSKGDSPNPIRTEDGADNTTTVTNPHPASSVNSTYGITIYGSLPVYATTGTSYTTTLSQLTLNRWQAMTFTGIQMPDTKANEPLVIETPRKLQSFMSYNEVSGKYDVSQMSNLTMTSINKTVNGVSRPYFRYVWSGGAQGTVRYEIKTY